jgi:hypothetical protein
MERERIVADERRAEKSCRRRLRLDRDGELDGGCITGDAADEEVPSKNLQPHETERRPSRSVHEPKFNLPT